MDAEEIKRYLEDLNDELRTANTKGEVCLYGGAVMCLVYEARPSTRDVDAIFKPASEMREAIRRVAEKHNLRSDWLNDGVKGFVVSHSQRILFAFSYLKIYVPEPDYLLAMKVLAARADTMDRTDVELLINALKLKSADEVFTILENYYPRQQIKPATQFFVEELFEQ